MNRPARGREGVMERHDPPDHPIWHEMARREELEAELAQLRALVWEAVDLQRIHYGNATNLHLAMIGWVEQVHKIM